MYKVINNNLGWTCPRCGSVYGPTVMECWRCNKNEQNYNVTCTTTTCHGEDGKDE